MIVTLTNGELLSAANVGIRRHVQALARDRKNADGCSDEDGWRCHIEGAAGERVVAKALGIYWSESVGPLGRSDVGPFQVRTRSDHSYDLVLTERDVDDDVFILVTGIAPSFVIRGWIVARDGKRPEYVKDRGRGERFWVPQAVLHPLDQLPGHQVVRAWDAA